MRQFAFTLKLNPEMKDEYQEIHENIWPEFVKILRKAGMKNQSTFFKEDGTLFLYFESDDPEKSLREVSNDPLNIKWQKEMDRFFGKESKKEKTGPKDKNILFKARPEIEVLELIYHKE